MATSCHKTMYANPEHSNIYTAHCNERMQTNCAPSENPRTDNEGQPHSEGQSHSEGHRAIGLRLVPQLFLWVTRLSGSGSGNKRKTPQFIRSAATFQSRRIPQRNTQTHGRASAINACVTLSRAHKKGKRRGGDFRVGGRSKKKIQFLKIL